MMKLAIVLALAVGAYAGGCYLQEDYACVRKNAVKCGGDICYGHCDVDYREYCDRKVGFRTVCQKEDYCKKIEVPCGHDGSDGGGLYCGLGDECVADRECKLIPANKRRSFAGWHSTPKGRGFFEVCKDVYSCAAFDPWALDVDAIEVTCTKEYKIVEDVGCDGLWGNKFGGVTILKNKFFKMNSGFSCGDRLVGRVICLEADARIRVETCGDGTVCDPGYECATREICSEVAVKKPVCARRPKYTCLTSGSGSSICGNQVCSHSQRCEVITNKICPSGPVPVPVIPVPVPGPVIPVPVPFPVPTPTPTPTPTPVPTPQPGPSTPFADSSSFSLSDDLGTLTDAYARAGGNAVADSIATATGTGLLSESDALADPIGTVATTNAVKDATSADGTSAQATAEGVYDG